MQKKNTSAKAAKIKERAAYTYYESLYSLREPVLRVI
jgi:hypothetical protein